MNKSLLITLTLTAFLLVPQVHAEDRTGSTDTTTKRRPEIQEIRQDVKEGRQEVKTARQTVRSDVAKLHAEQLEKHFNFYYARLNNIITRFQSRLDALKAAGKDTTPTQVKLDAAKAKLAEAKAKGDAAVAAFKAIDPAKFSEQRTQVLAARDLAVAARSLFVETQRLLKEALTSLKTISKPAVPAASAAVRSTL